MNDTQELKSSIGITDLMLPSDAAVNEFFKSPAPEIKNTDATDLVKNVLFLSVRRGALGNVKKVKDEILNTTADHALLRVSKTLLESPELDAIRKHDYELRKWLGHTCLPFDTGVLLLPRGFQAAAKEKFAAHKAEREALVDELIAVYPERVKESKAKLGPFGIRCRLHPGR